MNTYSGLSPRTTAYVVRDLLKRGFPYLVFEKFGEAKTLGRNQSDSMKFRRYFLAGATFDSLTGAYAGRFTPHEYWSGEDATIDVWDFTTTNNGSNYGHVLQDGVTPDAVDLDSEDITVTLTQLGDRTVITDRIKDFHEDDVLQEAIEILGEQAAFVVERHRLGVLKGCTNVFFNGGAAITDVDLAVSRTFQRKITRTLKRNLAKPITRVVKSSVKYGTKAVPSAFIAVCHPDLETDIRNMDGFKDAVDYGSVEPLEGEIGSVDGVRYILSTVVAPSLGGGSTSTTGMLNDGTNCDAYPIVYIGKQAYATVALKGANSIQPMVVQPGTPSDSDPLGQRGHVSWKTYTATVILNPAWMAVAWVSCTE